MTRTGKVARLPREIREQLNQRLLDGVPGRRLVEWLNDLPEVQEVMIRDFEGVAINEPNLTKWKQGGYRDWERLREARECAGLPAEPSDDLDDAGGGRLAGLLAAKLVMDTLKLLEDTADSRKRWRYLCEALRDLARGATGSGSRRTIRANQGQSR